MKANKEKKVFRRVVIPLANWEGLVVYQKEYILPEKIRQFVEEEEITIEKHYAIVKELKYLYKLLYMLYAKGHLKIKEFSLMIRNEECGNIYINNAWFSVDKIIDYVSKTYPRLSTKLEKHFKHIAVTPIPLLESVKTLMIYKVGEIRIDLCPAGFVFTPVEVYENGRIEYKDWHELDGIRDLLCNVHIVDREEYESLKSLFGDIFSQNDMIVDKKEIVIYPDRITLKLNNLEITTYYTDRVVINIGNIKKLLKR